MKGAKAGLRYLLRITQKISCILTHRGHKWYEEGGMSPPRLRSRSKKALKLALVIIGAFFVAEALGGYFTNSLALLSDAGHLLSDVGALVLALLAFWFAERPITPSQTYGYYRVEILAALVNGLTLWGVAAFIGYEAYRRLIDPPTVQSLPMLIIALVGFLGQGASTLILRQAARESLNAQGAFLHIATDALQSVGVIFAGILMLLFRWYIADPIISVVIAVLITWSGGRLVAGALRILLESTPSHIDIQSLKRALEAVEGVKEVHDLHTWTITSGYDAMSAHIILKEGLTHQQAQGVLARLRDLATRKFRIEHVTIQLEDRPMGCQENHSPPSA